MLSYTHRLPLWIDKLYEHLGRLDAISLKQQQQAFVPQYPVVFQFAAIAPKEMPVQEKVEQKMKQDVLAKLVNNRASLEVEKPAPETVGSEQMAQSMP